MASVGKSVVRINSTDRDNGGGGGGNPYLPTSVALARLVISRLTYGPTGDRSDETVRAITSHARANCDTVREESRHRRGYMGWVGLGRETEGEGRTENLESRRLLIERFQFRFNEKRTPKWDQS